MKPPKYWRQTKKWSDWNGRMGTVIGSTQIKVAPPDQAHLVPYSYVIVDFGDKRGEFMGAGHEALMVGQKVICVLKKTGISGPEEIINYGIKVKKYDK